jgi:TonB family protein
MTIYWLTIAGLLVLPGLADAQYIGGTVIDNARSPARRLRVVAFQGNADVSDVVTDSSGNFYVGPLKPGLYRLRIGDGTPAPVFSDTLRVTKDGFVQGRFSHDATGRRVYYEFEVAKPVAPLPGQRAPRYPDDLRNSGVQGEVIAQFVVDTLGRFVEGSFSTLPGSDPRFAPAVLAAIQTFAFYPGELSNGRKIRQYVHMPFQFSLR